MQFKHKHHEQWKKVVPSNLGGGKKKSNKENPKQTPHNKPEQNPQKTHQTQNNVYIQSKKSKQPNKTTNQPTQKNPV